MVYDGTINQYCQGIGKIGKTNEVDKTEPARDANDNKLTTFGKFINPGTYSSTTYDYCTFNDCILTEWPDCTTEIDDDELYVKDANGEVWINFRNYHGFKYDVCYKCTNHLGLSLTNSAAWSVTLTGICGNTLVDSTVGATYELSYNMFQSQWPVKEQLTEFIAAKQST
jgi:hypothetical protein